MARTRLTCTEGGSNKFWEGWVEGNTLSVRFGKIGTDGQTKLKKLASPTTARAELAKVLAEKRKKGYIGERESPTKNAKKPAGMATFGLTPDDWYEGANRGHPFEVRFHDVLTAEQKALVAQIVYTKLKTGPLNPPDTAWLWCGEWTLFFCGQRWDDAEDNVGDFHEACSLLRKAFEAVSKKVPVAELVFLGLREAQSGTNDDRTPTAGPRWPRHDFSRVDAIYGTGKRFKPKSAPKSDPAFEKVRARFD